MFGRTAESFSLTEEQLVVTGREMNDAERGMLWSVVATAIILLIHTVYSR